MKRLALHAVVLLTLSACTESTRPAAPPSPQGDVALSVTAACPTPANVVVHDEAGLLTALDAAYPGEVIGLDGFFGITADVTIATPGVTLTCATPGSGLFAIAGSGVQDMLIASASHVVVDRLVLDGTQAGDSPYFAANDLASYFAENIRFTNNSVTCSPGGECIFVAGGIGPVVSDNHFQATAPFSGIHLQADAEGIDGARVERNTIVTTTPFVGFDFLAAIRVFNARNVVLADNTVAGPWANSLGPQGLSMSVITGNRVKGATLYGMQFSGNPNFPALLMLNNTLRSNVVTSAGTGGVFAKLACGNAFVGNSLQGNAGNIGLLFDATTGANTVVGNGTIVIDNGAFDCNGDGVNDPNIITGAGAVTHGVTLGEVVSGAIRRVHGITLQ
ncbi:MAG: hypothetical protein DMD69_13610 [Gemmatimonadetes bacterium]|nr:MAG: hypothetical protein DMD69_13610 [Gemmatimonadota bacterium]